MSTVLWTSEKFQPNCFFVYMTQSWFLAMNIFFKKDVFLSNSSLIENSAFNFKQKTKFIGLEINSKNNLIFYTYYFYSLKAKMLILLLYNKKNKIQSIDKLYKSSDWLERETGEMFKILYTNKTDNRRLLLDYSKQENPLLKDFPTEGFNDVFYCFFENQTVNVTNNSIEL